MTITEALLWIAFWILLAIAAVMILFGPAAPAIVPIGLAYGAATLTDKVKPQKKEEPSVGPG